MLCLSDRWWFLWFVFGFGAYVSWKQIKDLLNFTDELTINYFMSVKYGYKETVTVYNFEANCGVRYICPEDSFSVYLSTGTPKNNKSRLCVSGKHVIQPRTKAESRGLNAAIVEPNTFQVISVRNFDTYMYNKTVDILKWLDGMINNHILIIFTTDEASARLDGEVRSSLNYLGSGKVQNLQFRSQWYMITQKGTSGFTVYEKITYSKKNSWGDDVEFKGCIPRKIPKKELSVDEPLKENKRRAQFCEGKKMNKYKGFCNEPRFEILMPALLTNKTLIGNPVYFLPLFIFASTNIEVFIASIDSIIHQPGIVLSMVTVLYESHQTDIHDIARVYGIRSNKTVFGKTFEERMQQARNYTQKLYPSMSHLIVLDSNVIPSPDFMFFFAQTYGTLVKDNTALGISAWSANCYKHDGNVRLVYRVDRSPRDAALITTHGQHFHGEIFAPDVPRVQGLETCHLPSLEQGK